MNYKKTLLTTSIILVIFGTTQANDYISIISPEKNVYDVIENSVPVATSWIDKNSEFNCLKEFSAYDYPLGQTFTQNENCLQKQERTVTTTELFNGVPRTTVNIENQNINVVVSYLDTGKENYKTGNQRIQYSTWIDNGINYNCENFTPLSTTVRLGDPLSQNRNCSQDQNRTKTIYDIWADTSESVFVSSIESQTLIENESINTIGTGLATSCKVILDSGWSQGSGVYELNLSSGNVNVTCDMDRNGGGWMLVSDFNWYLDINNMPNALVKTVNRTISTYPKLLDGWYIPDILSANTNNVQWTEIESQPITPWTQTMIEFEGIGHRSLDEFYNINNNGISDRDTINGQYTDGFSFSAGDQGSRKHLYTVAVGYAPFDDGGRLNNTLSWLGNNYDFKDQSSSYSEAYPSTAVYSRGRGNEILSPMMTESTDKISLRLMADQVYSDETIGIRKYILWVK